MQNLESAQKMIEQETWGATCVICGETLESVHKRACKSCVARLLSGPEEKSEALIPYLVFGFIIGAVLISLWVGR